MSAASEFQIIQPNLAIWSAWCGKSKVDLFSTAIILPGDGGLVLIDPIRLAPDALAGLTSRFGIPKTILLTSGNHERDSGWFLHHFPDCGLAAHSDAIASLEQRAEIALPLPGIQLIELPGAAPGEIGILIEENRTLILGDILINLDNFGFGLLPDKYATDPKQLRQSVRKIVSLNPGALIFAHGQPILTNVPSRLTELLSA